MREHNEDPEIKSDNFIYRQQSWQTFGEVFAQNS